jgi:hypothetical protein
MMFASRATMTAIPITIAFVVALIKLADAAQLRGRIRPRFWISPSDSTESG